MNRSFLGISAAEEKSGAESGAKEIGNGWRFTVERDDAEGNKTYKYESDSNLIKVILFIHTKNSFSFKIKMRYANKNSVDAIKEGLSDFASPTLVSQFGRSASRCLDSTGWSTAKDYSTIEYTINTGPGEDSLLRLARLEFYKKLANISCYFGLTVKMHMVSHAVLYGPIISYIYPLEKRYLSSNEGAHEWMIAHVKELQKQLLGDFRDEVINELCDSCTKDEGLMMCLEFLCKLRKISRVRVVSEDLSRVSGDCFLVDFDVAKALFKRGTSGSNLVSSDNLNEPLLRAAIEVYKNIVEANKADSPDAAERALLQIAHVKYHLLDLPPETTDEDSGFDEKDEIALFKVQQEALSNIVDSLVMLVKISEEAGGLLMLLSLRMAGLDPLVVERSSDRVTKCLGEDIKGFVNKQIGKKLDKASFDSGMMKISMTYTNILLRQNLSASAAPRPQNGKVIELSRTASPASPASSASL